MEKGLKIFSKRLKELRKAQGYSATQMAEFCNMSRRNYLKYESGEARPSYERLTAIADLLDVSLDYLLGRVLSTVLFRSRGKKAG